MIYFGISSDREEIYTGNKISQCYENNIERWSANQLQYKVLGSLYVIIKRG
jgi:hypothetical protein